MTKFGSTGVLVCFEGIKNIDDFNKDNEQFLRFHYNTLSNELSYKYYTEKGYHLEKRLYKKDEYSFASWESSSLNKIIETVERGLLFIYKDLSEIPFYEAEYGTLPSELKQLSPIRDKSLIKLINIYTNLIKIQEFLEDIKKQTKTKRAVSSKTKSNVVFKDLFINNDDYEKVIEQLIVNDYIFAHGDGTFRWKGVKNDTSLKPVTMLSTLGVILNEKNYFPPNTKNNRIALALANSFNIKVSAVMYGNTKNDISGRIPNSKTDIYYSSFHFIK